MSRQEKLERQIKENIRNNYDKNVDDYINKYMDMFVIDPEIVTKDTPSHYDNSNGSLYQFAENQNLNAWEYDVVKHLVRCRKKGEWLSDINKCIDILNLYKKEQGERYEGEVEKLNH